MIFEYDLCLTVTSNLLGELSFNRGRFQIGGGLNSGKDFKSKEDCKSRENFKSEEDFKSDEQPDGIFLKD